ncbi:type I-G CRISPR-associated helicase/endonuclease Cas3g [Micromonospora sp. NPDC004704]
MPAPDQDEQKRLVKLFADFVHEVHGDPTAPPEKRRKPFPWQSALLLRIITEGRWPDVIDVPTGLGKTSVLDVAVFVAALRPELAKRRTFFVVDRRLVVDEAHEHATRLQEALRRAATPVCARVASALRVDGDDDGELLTVARMRGGVTWDRIWLERPDRHAIVTGTIDQVGSRLLFRGYGVSEYGRSIDAALVGTDSLIVVDEAHLANAFRTTVTAALDLDRWPLELGNQPTKVKPTLVTMSATSAKDGTGREITVHGISDADKEDEVASQRLGARKRLRLVEVPTTKKKANTDVPRALADLALHLAPQGVVGVVVNTVSRARAVFELLDKQVESILLTGRSRPLDRELLLARYYGRIKVGRDYDDRRPFIIVATQTIEVGANIDLDALVTESASLAALVQRLGRLNRLGLREVPAPAYVVHDSTVDAEDYVYGEARLATWQWLAGQAPVGTVKNLAAAENGLNAAPAALRTMAAAAPPETGKVRAEVVPYLFPATLDTWTRTSPVPHPDPPVAPYLHGIVEEVPPVTVVWRTGMPFEQSERWSAVVDFVQPVTEETIDIPVREVRRWLLEEGDAEPVADIDVPEPTEAAESGSAAQPMPPMRQQAPRSRDERGHPRVLRYPRRGDGEVIIAQRIRGGDTIVVPVEYGGCDRFGWHPDSEAPVVDVADLADRRRGPILRVGPHLRKLAAYLTVPTPAADSDATPDPSGTATCAPNQRDALNHLLALATTDPEADKPHGYADRLPAVADSLDDDNPLGQALRSLLRPDPSNKQPEQGKPRLTVTPTRQLDPTTGKFWIPEFPVVLSANRRQANDDSETGSSSTAYPGRRIGLVLHQEAVAARAAQMAAHLGLSPRLSESVRVAALWHDEGKRDIRFQTMLRGGRRAAAELATEPLAKSGIDPTNLAEARRAREAAKYPSGMRHEALSARIAALHLAEHPEDVDPALVLHLIASHHGRSRGLLPPVVDREPVKVVVPGLPVLGTEETVEWQSPTQFDQLNTEYGRWGLALLETVVRLADIWCSARDEEDGS